MKVFGLAFAVVLAYFSIFPVFSTPYMAHEARVIGELKHDWVGIDTLPKIVPASLIAAEDSGYCAHNGVEWSVLKQLILKGADRGGSTISQQMVKNLFLWQARGKISKFARKAIEIPLTMLVELVYSKRRIMEIYLNSIEYDTGVFGIEAAAQHHFNIPASALNAKQMALLAAVLPNPKIYQAVPAGSYVRKRAGQIRAGANDVIERGLVDCVM